MLIEIKEAGELSIDQIVRVAGSDPVVTKLTMTDYKIDYILLKLVTDHGEGCYVAAAINDLNDTWAIAPFQLSPTQPLPNWWKFTTSTGVDDNKFKLVIDTTIDTPQIIRIA